MNLPVSDINALKCDLASEALRLGGSLSTRVSGDSMLPTIRPGDTLLIERVESDDVAEGDIVWFRYEDRFVVHRVINKIGGTIHTQGDSTLRRDPPISAHAVLGKVTFIVRNEEWIAPRKALSLPERALAALVRHSAIASRVTLKFHQLRQHSRNLNTQNEVVPCQS